jgi:hypothetical protein
MTILDIVSVVIGILGISFAIRCYLELWRWARQCQHARIAIAFKRRVQLQAPLVEWLQWINMLDNDKDSQGRVVYRNGGVTVAITKAVIPPSRFKRLLRRKNKQQETKQGRMELAS